MSVRHFCTYFDHNYLPRAVVMLESLHEHCPHAHVHVLCLSDQCYDALTAFAYPYVSLIRLDELEAADPTLAATRSTRSLIEYYFTITPCLPWYLLAKDTGIKEITYLDADMMFFSSPEPIFEEAQDASVIITPHRFATHLTDLVKYGFYNVSWMTFRSTIKGLKCLSWYRDACLEWCKDELEADRFADQKYLDSFSQLFDGVHSIEHNGCGVAPWNLADAKVEQKSTWVTVNSELLIFYHAQGFKNIRGPFYSSGLRNFHSKLSGAAKEYIVEPYAQSYVAAVQQSKSVVGINSFAGIRKEQKKTRKFLRDCKNIFQEWKNQSLVVCWS